MTFFTIPVSDNLPWQTFRITLSGVIYSLILRYNNRSNRWILDIYDANGGVIILGLPILIGRNILTQFRHLKVPVGVIFANDSNNQQPTLYSFSSSSKLFYEDPTQ